MWASPVLWIVGIVVIYTFDKIIRRRWKSCERQESLPPGYMGLPYIGETLQLFNPSNSFDILPFIKTRIQRFGPIFRTSIVGRPVVVSADPEVNTYILQQEETGAVELWYFDTLSKVLSLDDTETRMNAIGNAHKYIRNTLLKHFGSLSLKKTLIGEIEQFVNQTLAGWSTRDSVEVKRDLLAMLINFNAKKLISYDAENSSEDLSSKYCRIMDGLVSFPLNIPGTLYYKCVKERKNVINILKDVMKERCDNKCDDANKGDALDHMIKNDLNTQKFLTKDFIINLVFGSLLASSESISTIIALVLKFLAENPLAVDDLVAEHEAVIKSRSDPNSALTWDEYKSMTFTNQIINETVRMANVAPGLLRRAVKDVEVKGFVIPAGWTIMLVTSTLHLSSNTYSDPLTFNPWRWNDLEADVISKNFMPFGRGIRQCPGADYTRAFMATFIHVLVVKYRWTKTKGGDVTRNPNLGFGRKGIHMNFSKK